MWMYDQKQEGEMKLTLIAINYLIFFTYFQRKYRLSFLNKHNLFEKESNILKSQSNSL